MAKQGTLTVRVVGDTSQFERAMGGMGTVARRGFQAAGLAAVAFTGISIKAFADFDQAMTQSLAIMGDVSDEMRGAMSDAAREVGRTTRFSAAEAAEAYFFLASAGMDAQQSIEALPQVAAFAQAGMFDLSRATDLATDAQSALGLTSDDAAENLDNLTRVTDVLVGANTLANASVEEFSTALTEKAGASMRSLNMDIEEGTAVLAVFADQGIKGSQAGTTFTATIEGLTRGARENADAFSALGVEVFDADGAMNNMSEIVGQLEAGMADMSVEQQRATLAQLGFNRQSQAGILALMGSADAIGEYEDQLRSAGGVTQDVADKQMETLWAQIGLLKDQFMDFAIEVGSVIVPKILTAVKGLRDWWEENGPAIIEKVTEIAEAIEGFVERVSGAIGAVVDAWREDGMWGALQELGTQVRNAFEEIILPALVSMGGAIQGWFGDLWTDHIRPGINKAWDSFTEWWTNGGPKRLAGNTNQLVDALVDWITEKGIPAGERKLGEAIDAFGRWVTGPGFVQLLKVGAMISVGIMAGLAMLSLKAGEIGAKILTALWKAGWEINKKLAELGVRFGVWIAEGIAEGIRNARGIIQQAVMDAVPGPGFLGGGLLSGAGFVVPGLSFLNNAAGTRNFEGGVSWVGERGPELVRLPAGSQVFTNQESERMTSGRGGMNFYGPVTFGSDGAAAELDFWSRTKGAGV